MTPRRVQKEERGDVLTNVALQRGCAIRVDWNESFQFFRSILQNTVIQQNHGVCSQFKQCWVERNVSKFCKYNHPSRNRTHQVRPKSDGGREFDGTARMGEDVRGKVGWPSHWWTVNCRIREHDALCSKAAYLQFLSTGQSVASFEA